MIFISIYKNYRLNGLICLLLAVNLFQVGGSSSFTGIFQGGMYVERIVEEEDLERSRKASAPGHAAGLAAGNHQGSALWPPSGGFSDIPAEVPVTKSNDLAEALLRRHMMLHPPSNNTLSVESVLRIWSALSSVGLTCSKSAAPIFILDPGYNPIKAVDVLAGSDILSSDERSASRYLLSQAVKSLCDLWEVVVSEHAVFNGEPIDEIYRLKIEDQEIQIWLPW